MKRTKKQIQAVVRARRWRKANPEKAREHSRRYFERHPRTPEQRARNIELTRLWRQRNAVRVKRQQKEKWAERKASANAKRRAKYALTAEKSRARIAEYRATHPNHNRDFYHRHREKFTGDGPWASRAKRFKRAWRKFTKTCAASRAITNGATQC